MKFVICSRCGSLVGMVHAAGVPLMVCGQKMEAPVPNSVEASGEKHVPVAKVEDAIVTVKVGSVAHPMIPEHSIQWVYLETDKGGQRKILNPGEVPAVKFLLGDEKPLRVYAYCNLHGLWMTEL